MAALLWRLAGIQTLFTAMLAIGAALATANPSALLESASPVPQFRSAGDLLAAALILAAFAVPCLLAAHNTLRGQVRSLLGFSLGSTFLSIGPLIAGLALLSQEHPIAGTLLPLLGFPLLFAAGVFGLLANEDYQAWRASLPQAAASPSAAPLPLTPRIHHRPKAPCRTVLREFSPLGNGFQFRAACRAQTWTRGYRR